MQYVCVLMHLISILTHRGYHRWKFTAEMNKIKEIKLNLLLLSNTMWRIEKLLLETITFPRYYSVQDRNIKTEFARNEILPKIAFKGLFKHFRGFCDSRYRSSTHWYRVYRDNVEQVVWSWST